MKISELATRTGVSADRLRHYNELGLIQAKRSSGGYRIFSDDVVREVHFIAKCREVEVSLKQIGKLLPEFRAGTLTFDDMIELMDEQTARVDQQISDLRKQRHDLVRASQWFRTRKKERAERRRAKRIVSR